MNSERDIYQNAKFMQVNAFLKCLLFIAQVWTRNLDGIIANIRITPVLQQSKGGVREKMAGTLKRHTVGIAKTLLKLKTAFLADDEVNPNDANEQV